MEIHANLKINLSTFSSYDEFRELILQAAANKFKFIQIIKKEIVPDIILEDFCIIDNEFIEGKNIFNDHIANIHFSRIKTICFYYTYQKYKLNCLPDYGVIGEIMGRVIYNFDILEFLYLNVFGEIKKHIVSGAYINEDNKYCWLSLDPQVLNFKTENMSYSFVSTSILSIKIYNLDNSRLKEKEIRKKNIQISEGINIYDKVEYTNLQNIVLKKPYLTDTFYSNIKMELKSMQERNTTANYLSLIGSSQYRDSTRRGTIIDILKIIKSFYQLGSNHNTNGITLELLYIIDFFKNFDPVLKLDLLRNELKDNFYTIISLYEIFGYEEAFKLYNSKLNIKYIVRTIIDNDKKQLKKILTADIIKDVYREFTSAKVSTKRDIKERLQSIIDKAGIKYRVIQNTISYFYKVSPSNSKTPAIYTIKERLF